MAEPRRSRATVRLHVRTGCRVAPGHPSLPAGAACLVAFGEYNATLVALLKAEVHPRDRAWMPDARAWVVTERARSGLRRAVAMALGGGREVCRACAKGEYCAAWGRVATAVRAGRIDEGAAGAGAKAGGAGGARATGGGAPPRASGFDWNAFFAQEAARAEQERRAWTQRERERASATADDARGLVAMPRTALDACRVLGLPYPPPRDKGAVKKAYRSKALEHHPDRGGDVARMQAVNCAWEILGKGAWA